MKRSRYRLPYNRKLVAYASANRKKMTPAEKRLWSYLRVYRQRPINHFIADFYCPKLKLVIEVDEPYHLEPEAQARDRARTEVLEGYGLQVVRFSNEEVMRDFRGVKVRLEGFLPQAAHMSCIKNHAICEFSCPNLIRCGKICAKIALR